MGELILHHYWPSPVSEKVRIVLGIKRATWHSVEIPRQLPKPGLMPLTGGYRLTPVLQVGADVYCDSRAVNRALQYLIPEPTLYPGGADGMAWGVGEWIDGPLFKLVISVVFADTAETMPAGFWEDRGSLYFSGPPDVASAIAALPDMLAKIRAQLGWMDDRLAGGRQFMLGTEPGLPDALAYHLVWFLRGRFSGGPALIDPFKNLCAWEQRVAAIGHGTHHDMTAEAALDIAKNSEPSAPVSIDPDDPQGFSEGTPVTVAPDSTDGSPPVAGILVGLDRHGIAIRREHDRVGSIVNHYPRVGYNLATVDN
jgi:glutathione S-transferase